MTARRPVKPSAITGHREEINDLADLVEGDEVAFVSCSYRHLLKMWQHDHAEEIATRADAVPKHYSF